MGRVWKLLEGDRVAHFMPDAHGRYPTGTVESVSPTAYFFPYMVKWDPPWDETMTKGAFQTTCFAWEKMEKWGMRPEMTEERKQELEFRDRLFQKLREMKDGFDIAE